MSEWTRTNFGNFPKTHSTFLARDLVGEDLVDYIIQDLPDDRHDEVISFMLKHFLADEPVFESRKAAEDEVLLKEISTVWREILEQRVTLICLKENALIAVNILAVSTEHQEEMTFKSKTLQDGTSLMMYIAEQVQHFNKYNVDKYLGGFGLSVDPRYRKRGIATELLKARRSLLIDNDLKLTSTGFSGIGSQKAAEAAGYVLDYEITYEDLLKADPRHNFPGVKSISFKEMSLKI